MQLACPHCHATLEFAEKRPLFCAFCGHALTNGQPKSAVDVDAPTLAASAPSETTADRDMPETIGGYRLLRRLGGGGMGAVFEAEEVSSGRKVAIKLIAPDVRASEEMVERFRQEGRLASAVVHPRCVFVLNADEHAGQPYIVMELMPGSTLQDLVQKEGPLAVEDAVTKILDVIDGLEAAHKLGVVHRDVKPSNCFLEADGRVKIGDFGLSKSLIKESNLTRTGAFLGTTLYAAPEQVRGERVDQQTDVYAVAATLYFLLTGKAPFQTGDAAATLARIVSDPAPAMRTLRRELPAALDKIVLRGLEKSRSRRLRSMSDLRDALAPFVPAGASIGSIGLRIAAYLIDFALMFVVIFAIEAAFGFLRHRYFPSLTDEVAHTLHNHVVNRIPYVIYFTVLEGIWGYSLGKWLLRLRVCRLDSRRPPGLLRSLARAGSDFVITDWYSFATCVLLLGGINLPAVWSAGPWTTAFLVVGPMALVFSTMRKRNGYRALYEFISGTRTVQLPWPRRRRAIAHVTLQTRPAAAQLPERLGAFAIRGVWRESRTDRIVLGEDSSLDRHAWVWLRDAGEQSLSVARQECGRATRPRWLGGGQVGAQRWDAFLALPGCDLPTLVRRERTLDWPDVRPVLEQLVEELSAAVRDGTLPRQLTPEQVWLTSDGQVRLLDMAPSRPVENAQAEESSEQGRAMRFLREVVVLALEGRPRPVGKTAEPVRAPLPEHARQMCDRLVGAARPYAGLEEMRADLAATQDRPTQVTRGLRAAQLMVVLPVMVVPLLFVCLLPAGIVLYEEKESKTQTAGPPPASAANDFSVYEVKVDMLVAAATLPVIWTVSAFFWRGGLMFRWLGLALARARGGRAGRWQCAWRMLLVWLPTAAPYLLLFSGFVTHLEAHLGYDASNDEWEQLLLAWAICFLLSLLLLMVYAIHALIFPRRGLQDVLAGTYLVPR